MNENNMKNSPENAPSSGDRRKAIKKIAVGVGVLAGYSVLPDKWITPVVGRIVLPAHAQTSGVAMCPDLTLTIVSGDTSSSTVSIHVAGCVVPATANQTIALTINGGSGCTIIDHALTDGAGNFSISIDVPCGPGIKTICASAHVYGTTGHGVTACIDDPEPNKQNDGSHKAPHPAPTAAPTARPTLPPGTSLAPPTLPPPSGKSLTVTNSTGGSFKVRYNHQGGGFEEITINAGDPPTTITNLSTSPMSLVTIFDGPGPIRLNSEPSCAPVKTVTFTNPHMDVTVEKC